MAIRAVNSVFVDTNVLAFANVAQAPFHRLAQETLQQLHDAGAELWVSRQVFREYLATLTQPQTYVHPLPIATLVADVRRFQRQFRIADDNTNVTARLLVLARQTTTAGRQIHDANIVATMQAYGIRSLLTHNISDFARFGNLITVLPLNGQA